MLYCYPLPVTAYEGAVCNYATLIKVWTHANCCVTWIWKAQRYQNIALEASDWIQANVLKMRRFMFTPLLYWRISTLFSSVFLNFVSCDPRVATVIQLIVMLIIYFETSGPYCVHRGRFLRNYENIFAFISFLDTGMLHVDETPSYVGQEPVKPTEYSPIEIALTYFCHVLWQYSNLRTRRAKCYNFNIDCALCRVTFKSWTTTIPVAMAVCAYVIVT